jgi:hypothetical protein
VSEHESDSKPSASRRWHRKHRTHDGVSWKPPRLQDVSLGLWCPKCHQRHPYNGNGKLEIRYEFNEDRSPRALHWLCPVTKNVVGTRNLGK